LATVFAVVSGFFAPAMAVEPSHVSFTLQGCRNNGGIVLPDGSGNFICAPAAYTSGNLGKGWNELDLVPMRVIASAGNSAPASQTYKIALMLDGMDAGATGYDVIGGVQLHPYVDLPTACTLDNVGAQGILEPGIGGVDQTIYRILTITQAAGTDCTIDFYGRLALGSHEYPGASLHFNVGTEYLSTSGIGAKDVSIPVNEILPQEISKTMTAQQGSSNLWSISKTANPTNVTFANTCDGTASTSSPVTVTVSWTKTTGPSGNIDLSAIVTLTNPASRQIQTTVSDQFYTGSTSSGTPVGSPIVTVKTVPASGSVVFTDTVSIDPLAHPTWVAANYNDVATATYQDVATGIPVPGDTQATATASLVTVPASSGATAVVTDSETMTGTGLSFRVTGISGASGTFNPTYTPGNSAPLVTSLGWTSGTLTGGGSVTFNKSVVVATVNNVPTVTSGTLADTATLTPAGQVAQTASASTSVEADAQAKLTIDKTVQGGWTGSQDFKFDLSPALDAQGNAIPTQTLSFTGGGTLHKTDVIGNLPLTSYTVTEQATTGWAPTSPATVNLSNSCSGTASFANTFLPAAAQVQKVTLPSGNEAGWTFTLNGPGTPVGGEQVSTTGAGYIGFATVLQEGTYTITETSQTGWDLTNVAGSSLNGDPVTTNATSCSFTVNYVADQDNLCSCTFSNTERGNIIVKKVTDPASDTTTQFTFDPTGYNGGNNFQLVNGGSNDSSLLVPGAYSVQEVNIPAGWDFTSLNCNSASGASSVVKSGTTASVTLGAGDTVTCTYKDTQRGYVKVVKTVQGQPPAAGQAFTFELRSGVVAPSNGGSLLETKVANWVNGGVLNFATALVPGQTYTMCEQIMPGWSTTLGPNAYQLSLADNITRTCADFTVTPGGTYVFTVDNSPPPGGEAATIGFWKNWSSCKMSNGHQKPVLDQTLALAEPGGIAIGMITLHGSTTTPDVAPGCQKAVKLLSKQTTDTGKNKASDPAFNLAAQLLAAKLNVTAGAAACPLATSAITSAQNLLASVGFNGLSTWVNTMTPAQKSLANSLASTLDKYNNNTLC
jgi:hypothetical protein